MDGWITLVQVVIPDVLEIFEGDIPPFSWFLLGIFISVLLAPLWNVAKVFWDAVYETVNALVFFGYTCTDRYMIAMRSDEVLSLEPSEYAWSALSLTVVVPITVLSEYEEVFGNFGKTWSAWCVAFHHTVFVFLPDMLQMAGGALMRYGMAILEALEMSARRACDMFYGTYVLVVLCISVVVHAPRIVYDVADGLLHGPTGVAVLLKFVNLWYGFAPQALYTSGAFILCGVYSRLLRMFEGCLEATPPKRVMSAVLDRLRERVHARADAEKASIDRLRGVRRTCVAKGTGTDATKDVEPEKSRVELHEGREGVNARVQAVDPMAMDYVKEVCRGRQTEVGENCPGSRRAGGLAMLLKVLEDACAEDEAMRRRGLQRQGTRAFVSKWLLYKLCFHRKARVFQETGVRMTACGEDGSHTKDEVSR